MFVCSSHPVCNVINIPHKAHFNIWLNCQNDTKLNQMISCFVISYYVRTRGASGSALSLSSWSEASHFPSPSEGAHRLIFYKSLNFSHFSTSANIWKGDLLRLWSVCLEPARPFWFQTKCYIIMSRAASEQGKLCRSSGRVYSCGTPRLMKAKSLYTLNLWQDPLKARALVYQFAFNITKMKWRALQRSGLFYLASNPPLPPSQPTALFLFSLFHFKCEVKVCVNICRASPPWRRTSRWFHVCMSDSLSCLSPFFPSLLNGTSLKACVHTQ